MPVFSNRVSMVQSTRGNPHRERLRINTGHLEHGLHFGGDSVMLAAVNGRELKLARHSKRQSKEITIHHQSCQRAILLRGKLVLPDLARPRPVIQGGQCCEQ